MFFTGDRASMWNWVAGMTCAAFSLITFFLIASLDSHAVTAGLAVRTLSDLEVTQRVQWALQERFRRDVMSALGKTGVQPDADSN